MEINCIFRVVPTLKVLHWTRKLINIFLPLGLINLILLFPSLLSGQSNTLQEHLLDRKLFNPFPLKDKSLIFTEEKISLARKRILSDSVADQMAAAIIKSADQWIGWDEKQLMELIPDAGIPRAFDINAFGCPVHGDSIFKIDNFYPWILDPQKPFKVECPVGHESYPSNDFEKYYESRGKIREGWDTDYVDIGWGWVAPDGRRYWFVAYANHWILRNYVQSAIRNLGRAYVFTGNVQYARKAIALLYRLSEVYPKMDYEPQSRFGLMQRKEKRNYRGRMFNRVWETDLIKDAAECYDAVWAFVDQDTLLQQITGRSGKEIRGSIERNVLEEGFQAYLNDQMVGNFGMHQLAILYLMKSRQYVDRKFWLDQLLNHTDRYYLKTGINYALYNFVFQDGIPFESPTYNRYWVEKLTRLAEELKTFDVDLFSEYKLNSLLYGPLKWVIDGMFTPALGDSGSDLSGLVGQDRATYILAFLNYRDTAFLRWIYGGQELRIQNKDLDFESLFLPDLSDNNSSGLPLNSRHSEVFAGYGVGILRSPNENNGLVLKYDMHGSHNHWDFLNLELFAHGQRMMPDLGYPDAMNTYVPGVFAWSKNTISHNTIVVDQERQQVNKPGQLHMLADGSFVHTIDASSAAYNLVKNYRRHLVMVDVDSNQSYTVDFFRVKGGKRHDYSLHGPPGKTVYKETEWSVEKPGTYAGPNVEWAELYDDTEMNRPDYTGGYLQYHGSGFQYLTDVREHRTGEGLVEFHHINDANARLRIHMIPDSNHQIYLAKAYDKPRARTHLLTYLISRAEAPQGIDALSSTFISVLEPYYRQSEIDGIEQLPVTTLNSTNDLSVAKAVLVHRGSERDIVMSDTCSEDKSIDEFGIQTDATTCAVTLDEQGNAIRVFFSGGSYVKFQDRYFRANHITGKVVDIDYPNRTIIIEPERALSDTLDDKDCHSLVYITNDIRTIVHPVSRMDMQNGRIILELADDLMIGKVNVEKQSKKRLFKNHSILIYKEKFPGATILDSNFHALGKIRKVRREVGKDLLELYELKQSYQEFALENKADAWVSDVGIGNQIEIKSVFSWKKK